MSRSFRDLLKFSVPVLLSAALLSGCGSGSSGSADLGQGPSVESPPPPVTVTETFNFEAPYDFFVVGTPPVHARFSGGQASGNGAWIVPSGQTAVVDFGTPADAVKFSTKDSYTAATASAAQKTTLPRAPQQAVDAPFDTAMYVRGSIAGDWAVLPEHQLQEVSANILEVTIPIQPGDYQFKVADAGWTGATNCGGSENPTPVPLGAASRSAAATARRTWPSRSRRPATTSSPSTSPEPTRPRRESRWLGTPAAVVAAANRKCPTTAPIIRIYAKDVLTAGSAPTLLKTVKGVGQLDVDELRQGGATRITRIEIENTGTAGDVGVEDFAWTANPRFAPSPVNVDIFYSRPAGVTGTTIVVDGQTYACAPTTSTVGCVARDVSVLPFANVNMTVNNPGSASETILFNGGDGEDIFAFSGSPVARSGAPGQDGKPLPALPRNAKEVILFYKREDNNYTGWGLHLFPLDPPGDAWTVFPTPGEFPFEGIDPQWGAYFRIALPGSESPRYSNSPATIDTFPASLGFIIHKGDTKDPGPDQVIRIAEDGNVVFVVSGVNDVSPVPPGSGTTLRIAGASAHWVNASTLLWSPADGVTKVELLFSPNASINAGLQGITGTFETIALTSGTNPQPAFNKQLHSLKAWSLPSGAVAKAKDLARGQLIAIGRNAQNEAVQGTLVQFPGALDALYAAEASAKTLGVTYTSGVPSLAVWAPTALKDPGVSVNIYDAAGTKLETRPMTLDEASGVWSVTGDASWDRKFYTISLNVYSYATNSIVTNEVTDPYSVSLATDSVRSQFVNLNDADLKPAGWDSLAAPALAAPEDIVLYELHIRDFSIADSSVPAEHRGKYTAFDVPGTAGRQHLQQLATAGLTHVHVLPAFDFATVRENPADRVELDDPVTKLCAKNTAAAEPVRLRRGQDDPPGDAGRGRSQPARPAAADHRVDARPRRFQLGLRPAALRRARGQLRDQRERRGTHPRVPPHGQGPERDRPAHGHGRGLQPHQCLRPESARDARPPRAGVLPPARRQHRQRLQGFLLRRHGSRVRDDGKADGRHRRHLGARLQGVGLPLRHHDVPPAGVDAEVPGRGRGRGSLRVHLRRGLELRRRPGRQALHDGPPGQPGRHGHRQLQRPHPRPGARRRAVRQRRQPRAEPGLHLRLVLRAECRQQRQRGRAPGADRGLGQHPGLAGWRPRELPVHGCRGAVTTGADVDYRGQKSGYTKDPQEAINYISKHDNETIWDISQYKHATGTALAERVRADNVGMSVIMLAQGIPFLQAGTEILRSKSMDRNSYDSGDWYNEIDWTLATSKWNQGLPRPPTTRERRAGEERHPRRDRGAGPGGPPGGARELQGTAARSARARRCSGCATRHRSTSA